MAQALKNAVVVTGFGHVMRARVSGVIDDGFGIDVPNRETATAAHWVLELSGVTEVTSSGVRRWMDAIGTLVAKASSITLLHAPPCVVDQLNLVAGFGACTQLISVLAPYQCDRCERSALRHVELARHADVLARDEAPAQSCSRCGAALVLSEQPEEFFDYARKHPPTVDPVVAKYLQWHRPTVADDSTPALKRVEADVTYFRVPNRLGADLNVRRLGSGLDGRVVYDFGGTTHIAPGAEARVVELLALAAERAAVILWRVSPGVFSVIPAEMRSQVAFASLGLVAECRTCGIDVRQLVAPSEYLAAYDRGEHVWRACEVCGGDAYAPRLDALAEGLRACKLDEATNAELEALEHRALTQLLELGATIAPAAPGHAPTSNLQIMKRLGQGGMAEVFLARQLGIKGFEKFVVVKKILEGYAESPEFVEMLFAEARMNALLAHPNIVQTYDVGLMDGTAYLTMEYVRGPDVKKIMSVLRRAGRRMPVEYTLRIAAEVAGALHYAHTYVDPAGQPRAVIHRDVSPHNILVSLDGAVKLTDFGIAKVHGQTEDTVPGTFKGKIAYISPEAVAGIPIDARNDVFALGVTMFELLTGTLPFRRDGEAATLRAIMRDAPADPSSLNPDVPEDVAQLVLRTLEKDVSARTQSADDLREEIEAAMVRNGWVATPAMIAKFIQENFAEFSMSNPGLPSASLDMSGRGSLGGARSGAWNAPAPSARHVLKPVNDVPSSGIRPRPSPSPEREPLAAVRPPRAVRRRRALHSMRARTLRFAVGGIAVGLAAIGALIAAKSISPPQSGFLDLAPTEQLYVGGVRVSDEVELRAHKGNEIVAVVKDGSVARYGMAKIEELTETRKLPKAPTDLAWRGDVRATLTIRSEPSDCFVLLQESPLPMKTPIDQMSIVPLHDLRVMVACPDLPSWRADILALPGQDVQLVAKPVKEETATAPSTRRGAVFRLTADDVRTQ
nr:serine/threonine protein kinase [uncultured bacterium]